MRLRRKTHSEKSSYVVVTRGVLAQPRGDCTEGARSLVAECLDPDALADRERFPPRLLVLMATEAFRPFPGL